MLRHGSFVRLLGIGSAAMLLAGCAAKGATSSTATVPTGSGQPLTADWVPWYGAATTVASVEAAEAELPFKIGTPTVFDTPDQIYVPADQAERETEFKAVYLEYEDPQYGVVWIAESFPDIADNDERMKSYEDIVATNGQEWAHRTASIVTLDSGESALLVIDDAGLVGVECVKDGVQYSIGGLDLDREAVLAIANAI